MTRPLLITGATGLIGGSLVAALQRRGEEARVLSRDPERAARQLGAGVLSLGWDGLRPPASALAGTRAVIHLAGEPIFAGLLTGARRRRILASRIDSTRAMVDALGALPKPERPSTLVCASAVGIYGSRGDEILDENAETGGGFLADVCRAWEDAACAAEPLGLRRVSLRIGIVLSRSGGALPRLARLFRLGLGGRLSDGRQWSPWIHLDDLVALIEACLGDEVLSGPINAVAPEPVRNADLTRTLAATLRRPAPFRVPARALRLGLGELSDELLGSRRCIPQRALERGFRFRHARIDTALEAELRS